MQDFLQFANGLPAPVRLLVFSLIAISIHLVVITVRHFANRLLRNQPTRSHQKLRSIATLSTSALVFTLYFLAIGLILREFGVSLTAYLASASVIGLAVGFGSQGVVQDVVTGLTLIFSDLVDVGDLVEISGQTGTVKAITMRFVELENAMGAAVFVPNRTISNIINYPRGYIRCIVDITLRGDAAGQSAMEQTALRLVKGFEQQFPAILLSGYSNEGRISLAVGKKLLRIKFRIWPNRQQPIETVFYQELIAELALQDPDYKPWMVAITYEVERRIAPKPAGWFSRSRRAKRTT